MANVARAGGGILDFKACAEVQDGDIADMDLVALRLQDPGLLAR